MQSSSAPRKASSETQDFSLRFEMTAGEASRPSALSGTTSSAIATNPHPFALPCSVISTYPRCHLEPQGEIFSRSHHPQQETTSDSSDC